MAVQQLADTNTGFLAARAGSMINGDGLSIGLLGLALLLIWAGPLTRYVKGRSGPGVSLLMVLFLAVGGSQCHAYYDKVDQEEWVTIKANQTAFLVPQLGDNKKTQGTFDSAAYLTETKIAEKRIMIPHMLLTKKGIWNTNMYIPSAVLYVVTREPFVRMWTKDSDRGTSAKNEGFFLESAESLNIDFGVSVGAHIEITDAAKYLFNFGTVPVQGENSEFPSIVHARPLSEVMDTVVHQRVQTLLAKEFGSRTLDKCISEKVLAMENAEKQAKAEYATLGITIDYIGFATQLNLEPTIQAAINKVYIAKQDAAAAESQLATVPARAAMAQVMVTEGMATAVTKWDGRINLPNFVVVPTGLLENLQGLFKAATTSAIATDASATK